jgi:hypothetical protein
MSKKIDIKGKLKIQSNDYAETPIDELTWKTISQLHNATSNFSKQSFEIKKVCLTVEVAALTLIGNFVNDKLDLALFVTGLIIPIIFYFLDCTTYYYQDSLRGKMVKEENLFRTRYNIPILDNPHTQNKICRSIFNWSHWIYAALILLDIILLIIFKEDLK